MLGRLGHPQHGVGNVFGGDEIHAFIHLGGLVGIAKPHVGELGAAAQAGLDVGHAKGRAKQVGAQVAAKLLHKRFAGAIDIAAGIRPVTRSRAQIDDVAALALDHAWQEGAGDMHQALAVGVDHGVPLGQVCRLRRAQAQCQACVVDQHIDGGPCRRQLCGQGGYGGGIGHVQLNGQELVAQLLGQGVELVFAPCGGNHAVAGLYKAARHGGAKTCRCAGDKNDHGKNL